MLATIAATCDQKTFGKKCLSALYTAQIESHLKILPQTKTAIKKLNEELPFTKKNKKKKTVGAKENSKQNIREQFQSTVAKSCWKITGKHWCILDNYTGCP